MTPSQPHSGSAAHPSSGWQVPDKVSQAAPWGSQVEPAGQGAPPATQVSPQGPGCDTESPALAASQAEAYVAPSQPQTASSRVGVQLVGTGLHTPAPPQPGRAQNEPAGQASPAYGS